MLLNRVLSTTTSRSLDTPQAVTLFFPSCITAIKFQTSGSDSGRGEKFATIWISSGPLEIPGE